jgi:RimJ/RimL family protein N-acetyltransferase
MSRKGITGAKTARIKLVEIRPKYFSHVVRWRNDPENSRHFFSKTTFTLASEREWYERYRHDPTDVTFIILLRPDIPVGLLALYHIDDAQKTAEFGRLLIGEVRHRHKGLAFDACCACLSIAFCQLHLAEVYLAVHESNRAAIGLYERLGFTVDQHIEVPAQEAPVVRMRLSRSRFERRETMFISGE